LAVGRQDTEAGPAQASAIGLQAGENPALIGSGISAEADHIWPTGGVFRRGSALSEGWGRCETDPAGRNP